MGSQQKPPSDTQAYKTRTGAGCCGGRRTSGCLRGAAFRGAGRGGSTQHLVRRAFSAVCALRGGAGGRGGDFQQNHVSLGELGPPPPRAPRTLQAAPVLNGCPHRLLRFPPEEDRSGEFQGKGDICVLELGPPPLKGSPPQKVHSGLKTKRALSLGFTVGRHRGVPRTDRQDEIGN